MEANKAHDRNPDPGNLLFACHMTDVLISDYDGQTIVTICENCTHLLVAWQTQRTRGNGFRSGVIWKGDKVLGVGSSGEVDKVSEVGSSRTGQSSRSGVIEQSGQTMSGVCSVTRWGQQPRASGEDRQFYLFSEGRSSSNKHTLTMLCNSSYRQVYLCFAIHPPFTIPRADTEREKEEEERLKFLK